MRVDNVVLSIVCGAAVVLASVIAWRGRILSIVRPPPDDLRSARASALDSLRVLVAVMNAAFIAGVLVVGLGGRLVMRIAAATSGPEAQGLLTEADETVGEITFGGTVGFVLFVGILLPLAASFMYLAFRRLLPRRAWAAGLVFGVVCLGTFGVDDPLSPDNVDFDILSPVSVAVALVIATALLFGLTFAALAARFDATWPRLSRDMEHRSLRLVAHGVLVWLILPFFLVLAGAYVGVRTLSRGRIGEWLDRRPVLIAGQALVGLAAVASAAATAVAVADIV